MKKRINKKFLLFIIILFISIGFSYLSTTFNIAGLIGYKGNTWNIYFDNVQMIINDVEANIPNINSNKNLVSFNLSFSEPSETFKFSIDVVNAGTLDAMLSEVIKTGIDKSNSNYLLYNISYYNGEELRANDLLSSGSKTRLIVEVSYNYETEDLVVLEENNYSFGVKYVQAADDAVDRGTILYSTDASNVLTLNNAKSNSMSDLKIYGNTKQTQYQGYNLIDTYKNNTEFSDSGLTYTRYSDGTVECSGTTNRAWDYALTPVFNFLAGHTYYFKVFSDYTNQRDIWISLGTSNGGGFHFYIGTDDYKIININQNVTTSVRISYAANVNVSFKIRILLIDVTNVSNYDNFVYEPYVGGRASPNLDYPQDVNSVTGNVSIDVYSKNLLNYLDIGSVATAYGLKVNDDGEIYDSSPDKDTREWKYVNCNFYTDILSPGTYTFSIQFRVTTEQPNYFDKLNAYDSNGNALFNIDLHGITSRTYTFTITEPKKIGILAKGYAGYYKVQLEEGDTATDWVPYKKNYPISLDNLEIRGIDNYSDYLYNSNNKWYIHREIYKYTFDKVIVFSSMDNAKRWCQKLESFNLPEMQYSIYYSGNSLTSAYSTHFLIADQYSLTLSVKNRFAFSRWADHPYIYFSRDVGSTGEEVGNNILGTTIYYALYNPYEEEITDTILINQLNTILADSLFEGNNKIIFNSSVPSKINFDYQIN